MAGIERLIDTRELKTSLWSDKIQSNKQEIFFFYNEDLDVLTLMIVDPKTPKRVHYVDDHVALLYRPHDKEIIGLRFESFNKSFLPMYGDLQQAWCLSNTGLKLNNVWDLRIEIKKREPIFARELSEITSEIVRPKGLRLEPVPA